MEDTRAVYAALLDAQEQGIPAALATVVSVKGSVPRHEGSKMLVYADGTFVGTVGGGAMEALVIQEALAALADGQTRHALVYAQRSGGGRSGHLRRDGRSVHRAARRRADAAGDRRRARRQGAGAVGQMDGLPRDPLGRPRRNSATPTICPVWTATSSASPSEIAQQTRIDAQTYVAAVTRGCRSTST